MLEGPPAQVVFLTALVLLAFPLHSLASAAGTAAPVFFHHRGERAGASVAKFQRTQEVTGHRSEAVVSHENSSQFSRTNLTGDLNDQRPDGLGFYSFVDTRVADLLLMQPWFAQRSILTPPSSGPELSFTQGMEYTSVDIATAPSAHWIRKVHETANHEFVRQMDRDGASLVQGAGTSQLLVAAILAIAEEFQGGNEKDYTGDDLRDQISSRPFLTAHTAPYYAVLKQVALSPVLRFVVEWVEPSDVHQLPGDPLRPLIVVATLPNVPDGVLTDGILRNCSAERGHMDGKRLTCDGRPTRVLADFSLAWPCTDSTGRTTSGVSDELVDRITAQADGVFFGLSKLTGHAGVRHGWGWFPRKELGHNVERALWEMGTALSSIAVSHATRLLETVATAGSEFHETCREEMALRWGRLEEVLGHPALFQTESVRGGPCVLLRCRGNCVLALADVGIVANSGEVYGADPSTARVCLAGTEEVFEELLWRLSQGETHKLPLR